MKADQMSEKEFWQKLTLKPQLRERFESILRLASGTEGIQEADAAEARVIEDVRRLGQETLRAWAQEQGERTTVEALQTQGMRREGKKNSVGTVLSGKLR